MWICLLSHIVPTQTSSDCMYVPLDSFFTHSDDTTIQIGPPGSASWIGVMLIYVFPALLVMVVTALQWFLARHTLRIEYRSRRIRMLLVLVLTCSGATGLLVWQTFDLIGVSRCTLLSNRTRWNSGHCDTALALSQDVFPWRPLILIVVCVLTLLPTLNACLRIRVWGVTAILLTIASAGVGISTFLLKYECGRRSSCSPAMSICNSTATTAITMLLAISALCSVLFPVLRTQCNVGRSTTPCKSRNVQIPIDPTFKPPTDMYVSTTADHWIAPWRS